MAKILGLDMGEKRIGMAISDENQTIAFPLKVFQLGRRAAFINELQQLIGEQGVERIVLGLPLRTDGKPSAAAQAVREWAAVLHRELHIPVALYDERFTSVEAHRSLDEMGVSHKKRRQKVDMIAARLLLQAYLDSRA